jgi:hypothetical protein
MTSSAWRLPAGSRWPPSMTACHGCFVPMCWAGSQGGFAHSAISSAEVAVAACRWRHEEWAAGVVSSWKDSAKSSCAPKHGTASHALHSKPALMRSISTPTLIRKTIRSKGSEAVAAAKGAPGRYAVSRSSADYAARGVRGDPRGRKSGVGPRAANPR